LTDIPAGGLVGYNRSTVTNNYASGAVSGTSGYTGGLFGALTAIGSVSNSVWNTTTSGQSTGYGSKSNGSGTVTGLSTSEMTSSGNFSNWSFTTPWIIYSGHTAPLLRAFMTPLSISAYANGTQTYDGTTDTTLASYTDPGSLSKTFSGSISFALDSANVGSRSVIASGFYSDQLGYQISYAFTTNSVTVISPSSSGNQTASTHALINANNDIAEIDTGWTDEPSEPLTTRKQNKTSVPGIANQPTNRDANQSQAAQSTGMSAELIWDNHGSEYTGVQRVQAHPQFQHVFTSGDEIELHILGTFDDMKFGRISYETPLRDGDWRIGATASRLSYGLGGSASSLQAYGNALQRNLWIDRSIIQNDRVQMGWRVSLDHSDLNDLQDETGIANQRSLNVWNTRLSASREGENFAKYRSWFSVGLSTGELWFRDATADLGDASYAKTQGQFYKFNLSAGHTQALSQYMYASFSLQGQWSHANLDASQKMTFGGAQSVRAYRPGVLSGDNGQLLRAEVTRMWPLDQTASPLQGNLATALFIESGWLQVYRRPWSGNTDNQAKLSGAGVSLSWNAPKHWSASLSLSHALGKTPSLLTGSASLHTSAWVELVRKFH
jgi:hypothetical protein